MSKKVFILGSTGCVGHYMIEELSHDHPEHAYFLLCRTPKKVPAHIRELSSITIVEGSLEHIEDHKDLLWDMDQIVHIATRWGVYKETYNVNVTKTVELLNYLNPKKCKKIVYFSTASIVGQDNKPTPMAEKVGTEYIQTKYIAYKQLRASTWSDKIIIVFPTLVVGGDKTHPHSHFSGGVEEGLKYIKILRWLALDGGFHFLHAKDISQVCSYLLDNPIVEHDIVLGQKNVTATEAIRDICDVFGYKIWFQIKIPTWVIFLIVKIVGIGLNDWDRHCIKQAFFTYKTMFPEECGKTSAFPTLKTVLQNIKTQIDNA